MDLDEVSRATRPLVRSVHGLPVPVPMMDVRRMSMRVGERSMRVPMGVRLTHRVVRSMLVLVMLVVNMTMHVGQRLVHMKVLVPLGEMQP